MNTCPRCRGPLSSDDYEGITLETCGQCHGHWLDADQLREVISIRDQTWAQQDLDALKRPRLRGVPLAQLREELPCPSCGRTMNAFNYGGDSGVILDKCGACGGIWLDGGELEKVQQAVVASEQGLDQDIKRFSGRLHEVAAREDLRETADDRAAGDPLLNALVNHVLNID